MFYLHMAAPAPASTSTSLPPQASGAIMACDGAVASRLLTPSRPKSAAPAFCVPTVAPTSTGAAIGVLAGSTSPSLATGNAHHPPQTTFVPSARSTAYVGFSPRVPSAPRPVVGSTATTTIGGNFQHVLHAHRSTPSPRRPSAGSVAQAPSRWVPPSDLPTGTETASDNGTTAATSSTSTATADVYHAMTARKSAEETAKQLARRIAHFRAQEEKVLREVQQMKQRLENLLTAHDAATSTSTHATEPTRGSASPQRLPHAMKRPMSATTHASRMAQRTDVKTARSREQLQFLNKQRRVLQHRNNEAARQQKEKRDAALERQREKDAAEHARRSALTARIQHERQIALEQRAARQQHQLALLEHQHHTRLRHERTCEREVQQRIRDMRDEEKNLALRLQALHVHQDHIKRGLAESTLSSPLPTRASPPRPSSARASAPPAAKLQTASPCVAPFAPTPSVS